MKIAFVEDGMYAYATGSPSAAGGAERDQWILARALVAAGWSATVGVRSQLEPGERTVIDGVEYVGIARGQILSAWREFLSSERPDWLLRKCACHLWGPLVEIARLSRVRTIFYAGCDLDVEPRHATLYRPRWWPLYAWGLSRTDRIFVQHSGQLAALSPQLRSKAYILPKVCDMGAAILGTAHADRGNYVAWVGTLMPFKRPDRLIEIARKTPSTRFVVCGGPTTFTTSPGYCTQMIERLRALPNVDYRGQVTPEKAAQVIAEAALLLSTSDVEGFPNTFMQAWSSGTPVITWEIDPDDIIKRARLGAVASHADCAVADIAALLNSPQQRDEIATRARRFVQENNNAKKVVGLFQHAVMGIPQ